MARYVFFPAIFWCRWVDPPGNPLHSLRWLSVGLVFNVLIKRRFPRLVAQLQLCPVWRLGYR